jgi:hypothetical protein
MKEFKNIIRNVLSISHRNVFQVEQMCKLENYLEANIKTDEDIKNHIDAALEEYFIDRNKDLFVTIVDEIIKIK